MMRKLQRSGFKKNYEKDSIHYQRAYNGILSRHEFLNFEDMDHEVYMVVISIPKLKALGKKIMSLAEKTATEDSYLSRGRFDNYVPRGRFGKALRLLFKKHRDLIKILRVADPTSNSGYTYTLSPMEELGSEKDREVYMNFIRQLWYLDERFRLRGAPNTSRSLTEGQSDKIFELARSGKKAPEIATCVFPKLADSIDQEHLIKRVQREIRRFHFLLPPASVVRT